MSELAKAARAAMKKKAAQMGKQSTEKVDSSDWTPAPLLNADKKTGLKPISRRAFKSGGKVEGVCGPVRADKMPRKGKLSGGALGRYAKAATKNLSENAEDAGRYGESYERSGDMDFVDAQAKANRKQYNRVEGIKRAVDKLTGKAKVNAKERSGKLSGGRLKRQDGGSTYSAADKAKLDAMVREAQKSKDISKADRAYEGRAPEPKDLYTPEQIKRLERGYKKGGRVGKNVGGGMDPRLNAVPTTRMKFSGAQGTPYKNGGAAHGDEAMDKALIKKMVKPEARTGKAEGGSIYHVSWGGDRSHQVRAKDADSAVNAAKQAILKKMPKLGDAKYADAFDKKPVVSNLSKENKAQPYRVERKDGGKVKKGKTNINIVIAQPGKGDGMPPMPPGGPMGRMPGAPVPMPVPPAAGVPGAMGAMPVPVPAPAANIPPATMQRKAGGRVTKVARSYADMQAGAASGEGRLQKTDIASRLPKKREDGVIETTKRGYPNKVIGATGGRTARKEGGSVKKIVGAKAGKKGSGPRKKYMFGGAPAEAAMVKKGIDPAMARNPKYQMAYGMAGGDQGQADFNYRMLSFLGGGGSDLSESQANNPNASMNPTAGLKAVLPGARAKGGRVYKSYKDMDAGAGSGKGRLEKAEIERSQRGR